MPSLVKNSNEVFEVCRKIINKILELSLPFPIIYIMLKEGKINIDSCNELYFTYDLELSKLDENKKEVDCAKACGSLLEEILISNNCKNYGIAKLIKRKNNNGGYRSFDELVSDWQEEELFENFSPGLADKVKLYWFRYRNFIVKMVVIISVVSIIAAVSMLFSKIVLRQGSFEYIGTERLK